ncbi:MAG: V-type ATP synthase subunit D [Oscillospiraceae bacterium]|nr:V-type ATP synthase subunit D [Oscillospiraceae bacterium]
MTDEFPTRGNLLKIKKSLALAKTGYDLMDRKRNILARELMRYVEAANTLRDKITAIYAEAFAALQKVNITMGVIDNVAQGIPIEKGLDISYRSVMGVELPVVRIKKHRIMPKYSLRGSNSQLDLAFLKFNKAKELTASLSEVENCVYRLAIAIRRTKKRANALKNIIIPNFEISSKFIAEALEEKDREEFSRLKVIKFEKNRSPEKPY